MNDKYVFISYKSDEIDYAFEIKQILEKNNISVWMDKTEINAGDNYAERIDDGVKNASAVLVVLSNKAQKSVHIKSELSLALKYSKPIHAYVIEECEKNQEFNFDLPLEKRCEAFKDKDEALFNLVTRLFSEIEADDSDPYDVKEFLKNRGRHLKEQKEKKKSVGQKPIKKKRFFDPNKQKKLYKKFPMNLTPYSREFSLDKYVRLSLNIHTFIVAAVLIFIFGGALTLSYSVYTLVSVIFYGAICFIVAENISGLFSFLIGKTKNYYAVVGISLITVYLAVAGSIVITAIVTSIFKR